MRSIGKISAVIPFFNEHKTIKEVINRTLPFVDKIFAINDGSNDGSELLVPHNNKVLLVNLPQNLGKGAAINHGFNLSFNAVSYTHLTLPTIYSV